MPELRDAGVKQDQAGIVKSERVAMFDLAIILLLVCVVAIGSPKRKTADDKYPNTAAAESSLF